MNTKELYDHITANMSAEEALLKLLEGTVRTYDKLRFTEGEEVHPTLLIATATLEMGWDIAIPNGDEDAELNGMIIGTEEYLNEILGNDSDSGCGGNNCSECSGNCNK